MYIPLVCAIVAQIYNEYGGARKLVPRIMTQLYTALWRTLLKRYLLENSLLNSDDRMPTDFKDLPQVVYECLWFLGKIALLCINIIQWQVGVLQTWATWGLPSPKPSRVPCCLAYIRATNGKATVLLWMGIMYAKDIQGRGVTLFNSSYIFFAGITGFRDAVWKEYRLLRFRNEEVGVSTCICWCLFQAQNYNFVSNSWIWIRIHW